MLETRAIDSFWDTTAHGQTLRACLVNTVRADCAVVVDGKTKLSVNLFAKWRHAAKGVGFYTVPERTQHGLFARIYQYLHHLTLVFSSFLMHLQS